MKPRGSSWLWLVILFFFVSCSFVSITNEAEVVQEAEKKSSVTESIVKEYINVNVGVILNEGNPFGMMGFKCIEMALSNFYNSHSHYYSRIVLHPCRFPNNALLGAAAAALYLVKNVEVVAIFGPTTSKGVEFVINLGEISHVPIIQYSPMSAFQPSIQTSDYFIHAAQDELLQVKPISSLIKTFEWREVVPIYVKTDYESSAGFIPRLAEALQQIDARIPYDGAVPSSANDDQIREVLHKLKSLHCRVFVVHVSPDELASHLFLRANEMGMMEVGYAWIVTTRIGNALESFHPTVIQSMQGALALKTYVNETDELKDHKLQWGREVDDMKLHVMGLWAYDSATALAIAVEQASVRSLGYENEKKISSNSSTDLDSLGTSVVGPKLLQEVLSSSFKGLAGTFRLNGRQLESSIYQIVNVIGTSGRDVGFWTQEKGLMRNLNSSASNNARLRKIMWAGDVVSVPKGWEIPTEGKKLRVGVPVKAVYEELVNVSPDGNVTGFCIDVFNTVMEKLGYSGQYRFLPFENPDGSLSGSYDDPTNPREKV